VIRQPAEPAGTNSDDVGDAVRPEPASGTAPTFAGIAFVHLMVVVSAETGELSAMIRNFADSGIVKHISDAVMTPRSRDQRPPGVFGWLFGKRSTLSEAQGPGAHVPLVTRSVTPARGSMEDEHPRATSRINVDPPSFRACFETLKA
jgi:hypothetical protein